MKKSLKNILLPVFVIAFIEVFVFNFEFWYSLSFQKQSSSIEKFDIGSGIQKTSDGYIVKNADESYIEINSIYQKINNIFLDIEVKEECVGETRYVPIRICMTDEANGEYRELPKYYIVRRVDESKYIRMHLSGESEKIKIMIDLPENTIFNIYGLKFNVVRKFFFHPLRIVVMFFIWMFAKIFSPKSFIYYEKIDIKKNKQKRIAVLCLCVNLILIIFSSIAIQPYDLWKNSTWLADSEYEKLTDALIEGHFDLNLKVSDTLKEMDNPYDPVVRQELHEENQEEFYMDYAYYNGKYYCYFGVIPAILFFVPFKLFFGRHLSTWICVTGCGILYCIFAYYFVYLIAKKYFKKVSLGVYLITSASFVAMSSIVYLVFLGNVYSVPIISSLLFGIIGLSFWLSASKENEIKKSYLVLGAIFIAMIIGCRPQLAIILLFAFPIFEDEIRNKQFFSKKGLGNTLCVIVPFLVIGCAIMYYNYARFGSAIDFGANYNLTGNDMTHRGIDLGRNWLGIFEYLFQPLNIASKFPYLQLIGQNIQMDYQGLVSQEPMFGGYLWFNPIMIMCIILWKERKKLQEKRIRGLAYGCVLSGLIIILVTIQMSGITQRYMSDFGWLFGIGTVIAIFVFEETYRKYYTERKRFLCNIIILGGITLILNYFNIFIVGRYGDMLTTNPNVWFWVKYVFFSIG